MTVLIQLGKKTPPVNDDIKVSVAKALTMGLWHMKDHDAFVPRVVPKTVDELNEICTYACQRFSDITNKIPDACKEVEKRSSGEFVICNLPLHHADLSTKKKNKMLLDAYNHLMIDSSGPMPKQNVEQTMWNEQDIFRITDPSRPTYNPFDIPVNELRDEKGLSPKRLEWKKEQDKFLKMSKNLVYTISDPYYFFEKFGKDITFDLERSIYNEISSDCLLKTCKNYTNESSTRILKV